MARSARKETLGRSTPQLDVAMVLEAMPISACINVLFTTRYLNRRRAFGVATWNRAFNREGDGHSTTSSKVVVFASFPEVQWIDEDDIGQR